MNTAGGGDVECACVALSEEFRRKSELWSLAVDSEAFAARLDSEDPLRGFRDRFHYPGRRQEGTRDNSPGESKTEDRGCIYFCGHSLGLQPKSVESGVRSVLRNWADRGVDSHFEGPFPAALCDNALKRDMARLVGARPSEVAVLNSLTVNIHVLLSSFYRPTSDRFKILMLEYGFHSDLYAVQSHVRLRGYDPDEAIVFLRPRPGSRVLDGDEIASFLGDQGDSLALVFLEAVHFYTGQKFDLERITGEAQRKGCVVGFDLAHAVGNVELRLHRWNVDFAMWCTYKYLNSGAGSLGAIFVHERHTAAEDAVQPMMAGWWGIVDKFSLDREFVCADGADRFKISNPSPLLVAAISASLQVFLEAGMERILEKQRLLTGYLERLLGESHLCDGTGRPLLRLITPEDPERRGSQLSLESTLPLERLEKALKERGIVCDIRKPSMIRVTPAPLYNTFAEVYSFVHVIRELFQTLKYDEEPI